MYKAGYQVREVVEQYRQVLKKLGINAERVILYGSFVKGRPRPDSDIDLLIVSRDFQNMNLRERLEVLGIAAVRIMQPIEAKGCTPQEAEMALEASFLKEILKAGISMRK